MALPMMPTKKRPLLEGEEFYMFNPKWIGVETVPWDYECFSTKHDIEILLVPDFYVLAKAESEGIYKQAQFRSVNRCNDPGSLTRDQRPQSPTDFDTPYWTDVKALMSRNIKTQDNTVIVAMCYTASLPPTRVDVDYGDSQQLKRLNAKSLETYNKVAGFYHKYFVLPLPGERFVFVELYKDGTQVGFGVSKYKIQVESTVLPEGGLEEQERIRNKPAHDAALDLIHQCPWISTS